MTSRRVAMIALIALLAGPALTLAWLAREQFAQARYVTGLVLATICIVWVAVLIGAALGSLTVMAGVR